MTVQSAFRRGPTLNRRLDQKTTRGPIQKKLFYNFLFLLFFTMLNQDSKWVWGNSWP